MEELMSTSPAGRTPVDGAGRGGRWIAVAGRLLLAALLVSSLPACSMLRGALGMSKNPPDEFAIMTKAPLVMPPDFALRPPQPGAEQPQVASPAQEARQTIFGVDANRGRPAPGQSEGEFALLQKAGADNADPDIRETLAQDNVARPKKRGFVSRVLWPFGGSSTPKPVKAAETESEQIEARPSGKVDQGSLPAPGATEAAPDSKPVDTDMQPKKKKGLLQRLNPF